MQYLKRVLFWSFLNYTFISICDALSKREPFEILRRNKIHAKENFSFCTAPSHLSKFQLFLSFCRCIGAHTHTRTDIRKTHCRIRLHRKNTVLQDLPQLNHYLELEVAVRLSRFTYYILTVGRGLPTFGRTMRHQC